ncbi:MAG: DUF1189 family protein [Rickettsiales bacterium]
MQNTSILRAIPKAFYSGDIYREVARDWQGFGFLYMFVLTLIISVLATVVLIFYTSAIDLKKPFDFEFFINQAPVMTISNGVLSTDVPMPYYIKDQKGVAVGIIDTDRPVTDWSERMDEYNVYFVIGKDMVLVKKGSRTTEKRLFNIPKNTNEIINQSYLRSFVLDIINNLWIIVIVVMIIAFIGSYLFGIVSLLVYGLLGLVINLFMKTDLSYKDFVRLSAVAATASSLFVALLLVGINVSLWVYFFVDMIYLLFATKVNQR